MKTLSFLPALLLAATLAACDGPAREVAAPERSARPAPTEERPPPAERSRRAPSVPARPKVFFGPTEGFRRQVALALRDLKRIGAWRELTEHLYRIDLTVRAGRGAVRPDRHLADARFWRMTIAHGTYSYPVGRFCRVRFFPAAMDDDLARWSSYYVRGLTASPPPLKRHFWAAILGHELFHCPKNGAKTTPEPAALERETAILEALRDADI